jgi:Sulfatase
MSSSSFSTTDHHLGRLIEFLRESRDLDDTLVFVLSDNGASSEGGPDGSVNDVRPWNMAARPLDEAAARLDEIGGPRCHNNYPWGWTVAHVLSFRFRRSGEHRGTGSLLVDGAVVGEAEIPQFTPIRFSITGAGLTCGYGLEPAVTDDYRAPFRFTGRLLRVVLEVEGTAYRDPDGEARIAIQTQ